MSLVRVEQGMHVRANARELLNNFNTDIMGGGERENLKKKKQKQKSKVITFSSIPK